MMKDTSLIPFIGIGSLGAMAINNLPPDIAAKTFTIFLSRTGVTQAVNADFKVEYSYDWCTKKIGGNFEEYLQLLLRWNLNSIFLVVNLGGNATSICAEEIVTILYQLGKKIIVHVSTPFYFQSKSNMERTESSLSKLRRYTPDISIGDNGAILRECTSGIKFVDYMNYRASIVYSAFRSNFFNPINLSCNNEYYNGYKKQNDIFNDNLHNKKWLSKATFKKYMYKNDLCRLMNSKSTLYNFEVQNKDLNRLFFEKCLEDNATSIKKLLYKIKRLIRLSKKRTSIL